MRVPVPLREGGEDSSDVCKFEAEVAAGGIREFFGGEVSVSSRMRNRLTTRRDWDILVWVGVVCLTYSPRVTTTRQQTPRRERAHGGSGQIRHHVHKYTSFGYVRVALPPQVHSLQQSTTSTLQHSIYCKQHEKASDDIHLIISGCSTHLPVQKFLLLATIVTWPSSKAPVTHSRQSGFSVVRPRVIEFEGRCTKTRPSEKQKSRILMRCHCRTATRL